MYAWFLDSKASACFYSVMSTTCTCSSMLQFLYSALPNKVNKPSNTCKWQVNTYKTSW